MKRRFFRRHLAIWLSIFMIVAGLSGSFAFAETSATQSGETTIASAADFPEEIPKGETYVLEADIDLSEGGVKQIRNIAGVLDGKGHTVTLDGAALAGDVSGTVQNLGVTTKMGANVSSNQQNGSIAMTLSGTVQNCFSTADVVHTGWFDPSGLVGRITEDAGKVLNSWFAGTVKGDMSFDPKGIAGGSAGTIKNCVATAGNIPSEGNCRKVELKALNQEDIIELLNTDINPATGFVWVKAEGDYPVLKAVTFEADKTDLAALINEADAKNAAEYEEAGWENFQNALAEAKRVNDDDAATAQDVAVAENALRESISKLEKKPITKPVDASEGAIEITNADELKKIGNDSAFPADGTYKLTEDITLTDKYYNFQDFGGILDGHGHTVTFENGSPLFNNILKEGIIQNLHLTGTLAGGVTGGAVAGNRLYGTVVNCYTEVHANEGAGFAARLDGGSLANCYSAGDAKKGSLFRAYAGTGTLTGVYCLDGLKNIEIPSTVKQTNVKVMTAEEMQTKAFVKRLNDNGGAFATTWGQNGKTGFPYFGPDQTYNPQPAPLPIEENLYQVVFTPEFGSPVEIIDRSIDLSPDEVRVPGNLAGHFSLQDVPADKEVVWSYQEVKPAGAIMVGSDKGEIRIDAAGRAIVIASIDDKTVAAVRVNATAKKIKEIKLLIDDEDVTNGQFEVAGSAIKKIKVQAKYEGEETFRPVSANRFTYVASDRNMVDYSSTSSEFSFKQPGMGTITVTSVADPSKKAAITVHSTYVAATSVKQTIGTKQVIHGINANSYDRKAYNPIYAGVVVTPKNASYRRNYTIKSSDATVAAFMSSMVNGYVPFKAGKTTFTAYLTDKDPVTEKTNVITDSTEVTFTYENPITKIEVPKRIEMENFAATPLNIKFTGEKSNYNVSDTEMKWTYSRDGIAKVVAKPESGQFFSIWKRGDAFDKTDKDYGMAVATPYFGIKAMKEGTVTVTGTPVDETNGVKPVAFIVTVKGAEAPAVDTDALVKQGLETSAAYISGAVSEGPAYSSEWLIFTHLRAGGSLTDAEKEAYYASVSDTVKKWSIAQKPTDVERVALALSVLGYDITDIEGVNLAERIYNHPNLQSGSNELAYALLALDARNTEVPKDALFTRETIVAELLRYQNDDGGFALNRGALSSSVDMTAMVIQALAPYTGDEDVAGAVNRAVDYLKAKQNANHGYVSAESDAQVLLALTSIGIDPLDEEQGFCNPYNNLITSLMEYHLNGEGFVHTVGGNVNAMASIQAAQALESYVRFKAGKSMYWNLSDLSFTVATVKMKLKAVEVGEGKAKALMSEEDASDLVAAVKEQKAKRVRIRIEGAESDETEITIPASFVKRLRDDTTVTLAVHRKDVVLNFDRILLASLGEKISDNLRIRIIEKALTAEQKEFLGEGTEGFRVELYADDSVDAIRNIAPAPLSIEIPLSSAFAKPVAVKIDRKNKVSLMSGFVFGEKLNRYMVKVSAPATFAVLEKAKADHLIKDPGNEKPGTDNTHPGTTTDKDPAPGKDNVAHADPAPGKDKGTQAGSAPGKTDKGAAPQTGDRTMSAEYGILLLLTAGATYFPARNRKKREE